MKTLKSILFLLMLLNFSVLLAQTTTLGDKIGPWKSTDIMLLGNDNSYVYTFRIDKVKRDKYGYCEAYDLNTLKRVFSIPINPADVDENLKEIKSVYYNNAGISLFYSVYDSKANTKTLRAATLKVDKKASWATKDVCVVQEVRSELTVNFTLKQFDDGSILVLAKRLKGSSYSLSTDTRLVVSYLDNSLQVAFSHEELLDFKNGDIYSGFVDSNKNIYIFYRSTSNSMSGTTEVAKYMCISMQSGAAKNADLWEYNKKDRKSKEIFPRGVYCVNDNDGTLILVSTYHLRNCAQYTNSCGFAIVKFKPDGDVISRETVQWPTTAEKGFMEEGSFVVFMNINNVTVENDHSLNVIASMEYDFGFRILGLITNLNVANNKIQSFSWKDRNLAYGLADQTDYSGQSLLVNPSATYAFYNQDKEVLAHEKPVRVKDIYSMSKAAMSVFNQDGTSKEIDLNLNISGDRECQLLPQQSIEIDDDEIITVAAGPEDLYLLRIKL